MPTRAPRASSSSSPARARCSPGGVTSARTSRPTTASVIQGKTAPSTSCRARTTSTTPRPASGTSSPPARTIAPNMAYIGWGIYVMARVDADAKKQKAAWSLAAHLGGKDISLWMAAYPSGFQPYRQSHFNIAEWVARRLRRSLHQELSRFGSQFLQSSECGHRTAHSRHLPVLLA